MAESQRILLSWIGKTDLNAAENIEAAGIGPIAQAVLQRSFDQIYLFSSYPDNEARGFIDWLGQHTGSAIQYHPVVLSSPTHFGEIYQAVSHCIENIPAYQDAKLTFHLSPGTPAMAAVWIILAKTRFAAELIESSKENGVKTATVPFELSAEYIPDLYKRADADIARLSAGLPDEAPAFSAIVHQSDVMKRVVAKAHRVAPRSVPVLIEGDSGTGKELLARAIHNTSPRRDKPFIAVNCGAISPELVESEFFGHEKGAFTGAAGSRHGHFETADNGTLFLDEIGELPLAMQVKLLRVLQEGEVVRVGASRPVKLNVRIIAATHRVLIDDVAAGRFREDLFYRLAVAIIKLPALKDRAGDLNLLIDSLLDRINKESVAEPAWVNKKLSVSARNVLLNHDWPGNIRELANTLTRAVLWSEAEFIGQQDIEDALLKRRQTDAAAETILHQPIERGFDLQAVISEVAEHYLHRALKLTGNNKTRAAELLKFSNYQTLNNWIKKYNIRL
ncbi:sigma-54-dependent Fis family transcriptional regulator [Methylobacter sp. BBA5.1]|uniref:sigma-54 interaction domain-containing protein n=1 Tax=Methylobacter sp. BBA5.1 TaxID=1495064 RepID=UPI000AD21D3E|nr:sigma 54-interacting transcriptional regulator [Methylobacter sp. BBA5.1]